MKIKTSYFGVSRQVASHRRFNEPFNKDGSTFETLGDKILKATKYGADIGSPVTVSGDADDENGVDVLSSPNHDFFDIADEFGCLVDLTPKADVSGDDSTD